MQPVQKVSLEPWLHCFSKVYKNDLVKYHLYSEGAGFNTQNRRWIACDSERDIAKLVIDLQLCVLNPAPSENRWWRFTANHRTVFTDEMPMTITCNMPYSPSIAV